MKDGTGLTKFSKMFPERFFDIGIAEQHAIGMAAGMAKDGMIPVVPIYSSFYQRGYDQVIHDVCIQNLPVILCADRAGIVGNDGETHQGIYDLSFFRIVPNLTIMAPKNFEELSNMLEFAVSFQKPIVIRYPRGGEGEVVFSKQEPIELGKAEVLTEGSDFSIIAIGKMVQRAIKVKERLEKEGIKTEVINARFLKPLDEDTILESIKKTKHVITIEDNIIDGGLGSSVIEAVEEKIPFKVKAKKFGYPDEFIKHGSVDEIEKQYGLDVESIVKYCLKEMGR